MLKDKGLFTFESSGENVTLAFNTEAIATFCELEGDLSLTDFVSLISGSLKLRQFSLLMVCAANAHEDKGYTVKDGYKWIDTLGGISGKGLLSMIPYIVASVSPDKTDGEPKKAKSR